MLGKPQPIRDKLKRMKQTLPKQICFTKNEKDCYKYINCNIINLALLK